MKVTLVSRFNNADIGRSSQGADRNWSVSSRKASSGHREIAVIMRRCWILGAAVLCRLSGWVALAAPAPVVAGQPLSPGMVAQLALDGPIGPAAAEYFDDASGCFR